MYKEEYQIEISRILNEYADQTLVDNKPAHAWKIKIDGEFVSLASKKYLWKARNHASSALRLHFESAHRKIHKQFGYSGVDEEFKYQEFDALIEVEYQKFLKERVEFVQLQ
jgi:hypothetical protein